ncbi:ankyrin repeat-containing domain protein [Schizothecium vesticola]|uniref:Ankyrin repeat-containing domain protein n=1 Tax=Schizothecium vesticola TaxID=314040 RepID=A0AA40KBL0_9PEZI|nr:ankyrin repeat-containing domain protein [Schizothecium vesticola]
MPKRFEYHRSRDSKYFTLVPEMLMRGEASLRDQDEHGASLIFYASKRPDMCRFLLQNGADVERFAPLPGDVKSQAGTPLAMIPYWEGEHRQDKETCVRLMVNAGCDPDISTAPLIGDPRWHNVSPVEDVCRYATEDIMRIFFADGGAYINTRQRYGRTPFLTYTSSSNMTVSGLSFLLRQGANVHDRSEEGRTCLHWFLSVGFFEHCDVFSMSFSAWVDRTRPALEYLINSGAEVNAVDEDGKSVSIYAYEYLGAFPKSQVGSFRGDLWDRVLAGTGFDVASYRNSHGIPRRAKYTWGYTREDFEHLWEGMVELCPYYHDYEYACFGSGYLLGFRFLWRQCGLEVVEEDDRSENYSSSELGALDILYDLNPEGSWYPDWDSESDGGCPLE